ncbi:MAG: MarR family transcriptional regulator [Myxococcota bacterium]
MSKIDVARTWTLSFRLVNSVIVGVSGELVALGLEPKELFVLAEVDAHPHPAALADALCMPKPSITVYLKRLEAAGFVKREIDATDLRRHRLTITGAGRKVLNKGLTLLSDAFGARLGKLSAAQQGQLASLLEAMR